MQKGTVPCSDDYTLLTHFGQQAICRSTNGTLHNKERDSLLPVFVNITDGKCGGNRGALDIPVSPHSVVIADRGYCDFSLLDN